ncbi:MAG: sigma-70 family RNA polymerase sigma factor [Alphaproteobacteria bacterium]|nr:sigma-70 family RNA polymerase sigma factor [Alphaproteobacteria bacterium]
MTDFIEQNKKYVRAVIQKMTGSQNEDLEQEVYIKTWQNMEKYQDQGKFKQWICMITANICRDYFRSKSFKTAQAEISSDYALQNAAVKCKNEERIDLKRRRQIVLKAVDNLPKIYREIIVLADFEEMSVSEISLKLKIPEGTVKSRRHKAKELLKTTLTPILGENL